jgi:hypothetical protein
LFDDLGHGLLRVLGARVEVVRNVLHIGQAAGIIPDIRYIDHTGNIDAAAADEYADAWPFADNVGFGDDLRLLVSVLRASARISPAADAAALASTTDWGMSFGPWKAPQT